MPLAHIQTRLAVGRLGRWLLHVLTPVMLIAQAQTSPEPEVGKLLAEADRFAWLKNWYRAEPLFAQAEQIYTRNGDRRNALYAHISLLRTQLARLSPSKVSQYLADQLEDPLVQRDPQLLLRCLTVKGDVDLDANTDLAERDWTEALTVAKQLGEKAWANRAVGELGLLSFLQGDSRGAIVNVAGALTTARNLGDIGAQIRYMTLIGSGMIEFGKPDQALEMFDKAISLAQGNKDVSDPMLTYAGKAAALVALGKSTEARQLLETAFLLAKQKDSIGYQADLMLQIGLLEEKVGQREHAIASLRDATRLAEQAEAIRLIAQSNLELSRLLQTTGRLGQADQAIRVSVSASRQLSTQTLLPKALAQEADLAAALKQYRRADSLFEEATDVVEGLLANAGSSAAKRSLVGAMDRVYLAHFRFRADQRADATAAFTVIEQARGRSIADVLRSGPVQVTVRSARLTSTEKEIARLQLRLVTAHSRPERRRVLDQLFTVEQRIGPLEAAQVQAKTPIHNEPVTLGRLQKSLGPDELLLEYVLDDPSSHCLAIDRNSVRVHRLPGRTEINKQVDELRGAIKEGKSITAAGRALYQSLLATVPNVTAKQRLVISPDGSLHRVPFETLTIPAGGPLLQSHVVSYAPSGTVLELLHRSGTTTPQASLPLLAVTTAEDLHLSAKTGQVATVGRGFGSITRGVFDIEGADLPPLPAAAGEVRALAQILGPNSVTLIGEQATESIFKHQPLDRFRVLHFAVHGLTSTKFPERSALVLRPDSTAGEDGLWQAREISRTRLHAELVTLSACELGSGRVFGQEGVASLVRPFLFAGAKTVVANLWESNDDFSRQFMREFYSRLAAGVDKGQALRQAKLELIRRYGDQASPRLWAGFVLIGESRRNLLGQRSASR